tara:strand:- start:1060 stop:1281 length:222 start_codon:yes stop_codon:yes gene_type:complete
VIKRLIKLFWRGGVEENKPPFRQLHIEDEFSKKDLIGEEDQYKDMSEMVEEFGNSQKEEEIETIFKAMKEKKE